MIVNMTWTWHKLIEFEDATENFAGLGSFNEKQNFQRRV